ncbi:hypothetical protein JYQ62_16105 [Nostoc sp. UHCC 0702]|nr:hypothetical protein JYQ62_16105 [Nostoc sp. UHCC 0702]
MTIEFDREESTLTINFDEKLSSVEMVKRAEKEYVNVLQRHESVGRLILLDGNVPSCVTACVAISAYRFSYIPIAIGVYDLSIKKYVIVYTCNHLYDVGQTIA